MYFLTTGRLWYRRRVCGLEVMSRWCTCQTPHLRCNMYLEVSWVIGVPQIHPSIDGVFAGNQPSRSSSIIQLLGYHPHLWTVYEPSHIRILRCYTDLITWQWHGQVVARWKRWGARRSLPLVSLIAIYAPLRLQRAHKISIIDCMHNVYIHIYIL